MDEKAKARREATARIQALTRAERMVRSGRIRHNAVHVPRLESAQTVLLFAPMRDEPDIWQFIDFLFAQNSSVLLPVVRGGAILPVSYRPGDVLVSNRYGTLEPLLQAGSPQSPIDIAFIPGRAFDETGRRLGRGGGYYDRFLALQTCLRVGVCFDVQVMPGIPDEEHDARMDLICTDRRLIHCMQPSREAGKRP